MQNANNWEKQIKKGNKNSKVSKSGDPIKVTITYTSFHLHCTSILYSGKRQG